MFYLFGSNPMFLFYYFTPLQTVAYLFAHKLLAPSKFYLLRGNHEVRAIQKMFNFQT